MSARFAGKVVIVTGAGTGIGAATAKRFHAEGAIVVLNGRRESKLLEVADPSTADDLLHPRCLEMQVPRLVADHGPERSP